MDNLTFDPDKEMNTDLAKSYIEKHECFEVTPKKGRCFVFSNGLAKVDEDLRTFCNKDFETTNNIDYKICRKFSEKLNEKSKLFCELDYLIREEYGAETEKHLELILKYLDCYDSVQNSEQMFHYVLVTEYTDLYMLGYGLHHPKQLCLLTYMEMAPLSYLFYEVCLDAGINTSVVFVNDEDGNYLLEMDTCIRNSMGLEGCTAVYTEYADIDSAVDVLIYSSRKVPWNIYRILVQESVYEKVISALSAKGTRMGADRPTHYVEAFATRRGTVAVTVGDGETPPGIVRIVTYRTVRELLTLLGNKPVAPFLSIWCSYSAQANEIAEKSRANYIWINNYADFDGPPEVALALYTAFWYNDVNSHAQSQIARFSAGWSSLAWNDRKTIILDIMKEFALDSESELLKAYKWLEDWTLKNPVRMQSNKITMVLDSPKQKAIVRIDKEDDILSALENLVRGYQVGLDVCSKRKEDLISAMNKKGIPIVAINNEKGNVDCDVVINVKPHISNKKVIQTTFSTIFA